MVIGFLALMGAVGTAASARAQDEAPLSPAPEEGVAAPDAGVPAEGRPAAVVPGEEVVAPAPASSGALAQDRRDPANDETLGEGAPRGTLPAPRSHNDPRPPVPAPVVPTTGVTRQAGIGGTQAYARAGVLELGGAAGFSAASNYSRVEVAPSAGIFVADNLQLSLLTGFSHFRVNGTNGAEDASATELRALIEPSVHIPFSPMLFGFVGVGAGVNYISGHEAGFALAPRLGVNILVGRSGILTPAASFTYSTVDAFRTSAGTVLAVRTTYGMNIGYTVMW
jgi:hypothetical protein